MLLAPAWQRLLVAFVAIAGLWAAVLWVAPSAPSTRAAQPASRVEASVSTTAFTTETPAAALAVRPIVWSGLPAPGGGRFDRFDAAPQPVAAPVNGNGQVAFYATVLRAPAREGFFLAEPDTDRPNTRTAGAPGRVIKLAAYGDAVPGGGILAGFSEHPTPALNAAGHVAFTAQIAGGRAPEGLLLATAAGLRTIAMAGEEAPGVPTGVLAGFEAPALNDNDELAFVATVRRGRDTLDVLYFWNGQRLQRIAAEGDRLLRIGGTMDRIGNPALNNSGVIAFPASLIKGPALGGIFVAGSRVLSLTVSAGDPTPSGEMILRFSERISIDDDDSIAFGAYVGDNGTPREAVLRTGPEGLTSIALEGGAAPGGGRYAGFGPWPTVSAGGTTAFIAGIDGGPGPLGAFAGSASDIRRIALMDELLPDGTRIGPFAMNTVAMAGPSGLLTFATVADRETGRNAIYCRCPMPPR